MQPPSEPWQLLVSPRVGLVTRLVPQSRGAEEPSPPYLYTATLSHFDFRAMRPESRLAAGKGATERAAKLSALGEAVEHYSAYQFDPRRTFQTSWAEVKDAAVAPPELVLYSEDQYRQPGFAYTRWHPEQETTWVHGIELPSGRQIALPASLVSLAAPGWRIEDYFTPSTSNGLAAGPTLEAAVLSGLYELMERDAFLLSWMNRLPAVEIVLPDGGSNAAAVVQHYARFGVDLRLYLLPTDLPASVVMAVARDEDPRHPARLVGLGCNLDPAVAVEKAAFELCQTRPGSVARFRDAATVRPASYAEVRELDDHPVFLGRAENVHEFDFLHASGERRPIDSLANPATGTVAEDLAFCVAGLTGAGARVAYVDLTLPDVRAAGYVVVRTVATGLQPIHFGYGEERLGGDRLFEAAARLGFAAGRRGVEDINFCPHPLA